MGRPRTGVTEPITAVYVIYSADAVGPTSEIDRMGPERHLPAGYTGGKKRVGGIVASRFRQTAGDEAYDFGWLAREHRDDRYLPAADMPDDYEGDGYQGHHRTWAAELNYAEWLVLADRYHIDLDEGGLPVNYADTLGSLTEYGLLPAVAVDNSEGWESPGYFSVIDSSFFLSFAGHPPAPGQQAQAGLAQRPATHTSPDLPGTLTHHHQEERDSGCWQHARTPRRSLPPDGCSGLPDGRHAPIYPLDAPHPGHLVLPLLTTTRHIPVPGEAEAIHLAHGNHRRSG